MTALYIILAAIVLFLAVILIRTLMFTPKTQPAVNDEKIDFDKQKTINALQSLIKCKTVSYYDSSLEDDNEFKKLIDMLPTLCPAVFKNCEFMQLPDRALLFKWKGKNDGDPAVLMAHYDVVPVDEQYWDKPPFEGIIEDGVLWGRGSLDTKVTFNGVLSAAEHLIEKGFTPEQDIYFAFSGGEEINGQGAVNIVDYFEQNNITPALVVDEGGAVVENVFPGVKQPCGLIGIAEKGMMNLEFSVLSSGGHASAPAPHTPIGILSSACCKVENNPFKMHVTAPAAKMFDTLGRHSNLLYRMIFANMWLFKGVLNMICKKSGGEINALLRTTVAFTQCEGSTAPNVIPPKAKMTANLRLNPKDRVETAVEYIKKVINDDSITLTVGSNMQPSRISQTDCAAWDKVASAVASTWQGCLVSPYLMVQCSDSRHWGRISDKVYRFSAMDLTSEERKTIHGHNERIRLDCAARAVEFYIRLIKSC
ncbi:MAG: M20/M25/M40 family metallo-hydrolase [Clostridia bacterium]|nr:M20/M25/M40 family metallo-hydrolase [Clostridia bacterium]